jgi:probable rRNA maturation factor
MPVFINDDQKELFVDCDILETQGSNILLFLKCANKELSVLLTDDKTIKELNKKYRDQDRTTDVLSFSQNEGEESILESRLLGDVVISMSTAKKQAAQHDLLLEEEIVLLLIHGTLHLLGFDHEVSDTEAYRMKKKTREAFHLIFPNKKPTKSCSLYLD